MRGTPPKEGNERNSSEGRELEELLRRKGIRGTILLRREGLIFDKEFNHSPPSEGLGVVKNK
jgi:hypothetical protein